MRWAGGAINSDRGFEIRPPAPHAERRYLLGRRQQFPISANGSDLTEQVQVAKKSDWAGIRSGGTVQPPPPTSPHLSSTTRTSPNVLSASDFGSRPQHL